MKKIEKKVVISNQDLHKSGAGFTLLEVIIYIGLLALVLSMIVVSFYQFLESQKKSRAHAEVEQEVNFVMSKIQWALGGAQVINEPAKDSTSTVFSVSKFNFSGNPIIFRVSSGMVEMASAGGAWTALTNSNVLVKELIFKHIGATGNKPPGLSIKLSLESALPNIQKQSETTVESKIYLMR